MEKYMENMEKNMEKNMENMEKNMERNTKRPRRGRNFFIQWLAVFSLPVHQ